MQAAPQRFDGDRLKVIVDVDNELLFSAASCWEIAIKCALGRLELPVPPAKYVPDRMRTSGVTPLPVDHIHALQVATLPLHHADPFDRLLVAQAQLEGLTILTPNRDFANYDVEVMWAV